MISTVGQVLRWCLSLGAKFMRVVPLATVTVVLATLVSQIAMLVAFLLPLKVVILLGSEGVPRFFPASFVGLDRDWLIVFLSAAAGGFYGLHLLSEKVVEAAADAGARRLLQRSQKMVLFEGQDELATSSYRRYARALAGAVFVALGMAALLFVYPALALLILALVIVAFLGFWIAQTLWPHFARIMTERLSSTMGKISGFAFLLSFGYMVADFILWTAPTLIVAIVSLLLVRQVVNRAGRLVTEISLLYRHQPKLNALFFHGRVLLDNRTRRDRGIWSLLTPKNREQWLTSVLTGFLGSPCSDCSVAWFQLGIPDVFALVVSLPGSECRYLVKLYDANRAAMAEHEATILLDQPRGLPALKLVGTSDVLGFKCHVFEFPCTLAVPSRRFRTHARVVAGQLLAVEPQRALMHRYRRSRPMLWQRMDAEMICRLRIAATDPGSTTALEQFECRFQEILSILEALPLVILNRSVARDLLVVDEDRLSRLVHWGRWDLEPIGAGWPVAHGALASLGVELRAAADCRASLVDVVPAHAELAALCFELERQCARERATTALELIPEILGRLDMKTHGAPLSDDRSAVG